MNFILITGASSGIGKEFARYYAAKQKNLILVARRIDLLNQIRDELTSLYKVEIQIFGLDITRLENISQVMNWVSENNIQLEILINNAGVCEKGEFALQEESAISNLLNLNINALVFFCHQLIPHFKKYGKGQILNVASMAAFTPSPNYAMYFASKAFVLSFTESIRMECASYGIGVSALCPGYVKTDMIANTPKMGMRLAEPIEVVKLGDRLLRKNKAVGINGFKNIMLIFFATKFPKSWIRALMNYLIQVKLKKQEEMNKTK